MHILQNEDDHEDEDDLILDQIEAEEVTCTFVCILPILFLTFYNFYIIFITSILCLELGNCYHFGKIFGMLSAFGRCLCAQTLVQLLVMSELLKAVHCRPFTDIDFNIIFSV